MCLCEWARKSIQKLKTRQGKWGQKWVVITWVIQFIKQDKSVFFFLVCQKFVQAKTIFTLFSVIIITTDFLIYFPRSLGLKWVLFFSLHKKGILRFDLPSFVWIKLKLKSLIFGLKNEICIYNGTIGFYFKNLNS